MKSNRSMVAFAAAAAFAALAAAMPAAAEQGGGAAAPPPASAQGGGAAAPPAATTMAPTTPSPAAPAVPMSMATPKPSPMLDQLKYLAGSWRCAGTGYSEGKGHPTEATVKAAWDLNGFFLGMRYEEQKTAANPMPVTAVEHMGYSDGLKKLVVGQVDSMGGYGAQASAGWESATMVWTGDYHLMGMKMPSRDTFVKKSENSLTHLGEVQMNGAWSKLDEETCYRLIDR